jgi:hypothetical protein
VYVLCGLAGDALIGLYVLEQRLTPANYLHFLMNKFPLLMEDVHLYIKLRIFFQYDGAIPHFGHQVLAYFNQ